MQPEKNRSRIQLSKQHLIGMETTSGLSPSRQIRPGGKVSHSNAIMCVSADVYRGHKGIVETGYREHLDTVETSYRGHMDTVETGYHGQIDN